MAVWVGIGPRVGAGFGVAMSVGTVGVSVVRDVRSGLAVGVVPCIGTDDALAVDAGATSPSCPVSATVEDCPDSSHTIVTSITSPVTAIMTWRLLIAELTSHPLS